MSEIGGITRVNGNLNLSRAIGDLRYKMNSEVGGWRWAVPSFFACRRLAGWLAGCLASAIDDLRHMMNSEDLCGGGGDGWCGTTG